MFQLRNMLCSWGWISKVSAFPGHGFHCCALACCSELHLWHCRLCCLQPVEDGSTATELPVPGPAPAPGLPQTGTERPQGASVQHCSVFPWAGKLPEAHTVFDLRPGQVPPVFLLGFVQKLPEYLISCLITLEYFKICITIVSSSRVKGFQYNFCHLKIKN